MTRKERQERIRWSRRFRELPRPSQEHVVLCAAGETILADTMYATAPIETRTLFGLLEDADVSFAVLSEALSDWGAPARKDVVIGPARVSQDLAGAGLDVVSVATNHLEDAGPRGVTETLDALDRTRIAATGGGATLQEAFRPTRREIRGQRIAFLGVHSYRAGAEGFGSPGASADAAGAAVLTARTVRLAVSEESAGIQVVEPDLERLERAIREARGGTDYLVAALNVRWWDPGEPGEPGGVSEGFRQLARVAVDAGVNLVLGSGLHKILPAERYKDAVIAYGTGSFFFQLFNNGGEPARRYTVFPETQAKLRHYAGKPEYFQSVVLRAVISGGALQRLDVVPFVLSAEGTPSVAGDEEAGRILDRFMEGSRDGGLSLERDEWHAWAVLAEEAP